MPSYNVDTGRSQILVRARSSIHDTNTTFSKISGRVEADGDTLEETGATASFSVDMGAFDAGDWLKNRKLKKDMDPGRYPTATFELTELRDVKREDDGSFVARAVGTLAWRGRSLTVEVAGKGTLDDSGIDATGTFDLDIRELGMEPPKILMFKVEPEVTIEVTLRATA